MFEAIKSPVLLLRFVAQAVFFLALLLWVFGTVIVLFPVFMINDLYYWGSMLCLLPLVADILLFIQYGLSGRFEYLSGLWPYYSRHGCCVGIILGGKFHSPLGLCGAATVPPLFHLYSMRSGCLLGGVGL